MLHGMRTAMGMRESNRRRYRTLIPAESQGAPDREISCAPTGLSPLSIESATALYMSSRDLELELSESRLIPRTESRYRQIESRAPPRSSSGSDLRKAARVLSSSRMLSRRALASS